MRHFRRPRSPLHAREASAARAFQHTRRAINARAPRHQSHNQRRKILWHATISAARGRRQVTGDHVTMTLWSDLWSGAHK